MSEPTAAIVSIDWPSDGRSYGAATVSHLGVTYAVTVGLDDGVPVGMAGHTSVPYIVGMDAPGVDRADLFAAFDAVEAAIAAAYDERIAA